MSLRTKEQRRAEHAFQRVQDAATQFKDTKKYKKYGSMAHKLPVLIRTAGLSQALAFVNSRGSEEQHCLLDDIAATLGTINTTYQNLKRTELGSRSQQVDLVSYMRLTEEVLAICLWYKRFAESVLGVNTSDDTETEGLDKTA